MASTRLQGKVFLSADALAIDLEDFDKCGCRVPSVFKPLFNHAFQQSDGEPQVILYEGSVYLVLAVFVRATQDKKRA